MSMDMKQTNMQYKDTSYSVGYLPVLISLTKLPGNQPIWDPITPRHHPFGSFSTILRNSPFTSWSSLGDWGTYVCRTSHIVDKSTKQMNKQFHHHFWQEKKERQIEEETKGKKERREK